MMGNDFENPFGLKTLKGKTKLMSQVLDGAVFPGTQGGPLKLSLLHQKQLLLEKLYQMII